MDEYAIRLEMKDALVGCHEFSPSPLVLHLSTVLQDAGFSGLLGFEKKKNGWMRSTNNEYIKKGGVFHF